MEEACADQRRERDPARHKRAAPHAHRWPSRSSAAPDRSIDRDGSAAERSSRRDHARDEASATARRRKQLAATCAPLPRSTSRHERSRARARRHPARTTMLEQTDRRARGARCSATARRRRECSVKHQPSVRATAEELDQQAQQARGADARRCIGGALAAVLGWIAWLIARSSRGRWARPCGSPRRVAKGDLTADGGSERDATRSAS